MDRYSPEYIEDEQPLDLSFKSRVVNSTMGNEVQQEGPLCLVKSCGCHKKQLHKESGMSYPSTAYTNRLFTSKVKPLEGDGEFRRKYELHDNQSNSLSYHRKSPSYSTSSGLNNPSNASYENYDSTRAFPLRNPSTMAYSYNNGDGRYDVGFLSQPDRSRNSQVTSLMDFVNDSIEIGINTDKIADESSKSIKRELTESVNESRGSAYDSKRLKIEDGYPEYGFKNTNNTEQTETEEKIDVVALETPEPRNGSSKLNGTGDDIKPERTSPHIPNLSTEPTKQNVSSGVCKKSSYKIPALDYLISKVLVERMDIPFIPRTHEIKRIFSGEGKGQLRLVDLIELQVEESLKV